MQKNNQKIYAIVGASNNPEKYGYKVSKSLLDKGFDLRLINLKEEEILGLDVYKSLSDIVDKIDTVVFVVPPEVTEKIVREVARLGIKKVWMQPGSESEAAILFCEENNIECIHDACIMMNKN